MFFITFVYDNGEVGLGSLDPEEVVHSMNKGRTRTKHCDVSGPHHLGIALLPTKLSILVAIQL